MVKTAYVKTFCPNTYRKKCKSIKKVFPDGSKSESSHNIRCKIYEKRKLIKNEQHVGESLNVDILEDNLSLIHI